MRLERRRRKGWRCNILLLTLVKRKFLARLLAEFVGTALLVTVVVGSGIAAAQLSLKDVGLQLLENSIATAFGLAVLILMFGPVSGAHFNPRCRLPIGCWDGVAGPASAAQIVGVHVRTVRRRCRGRPVANLDVRSPRVRARHQRARHRRPPRR